jgi:hypothetical protein
LERPCEDQLTYLQNRLTSEQVAATREQIQEIRQIRNYRPSNNNEQEQVSSSAQMNEQSTTSRKEEIKEAQSSSTIERTATAAEEESSLIAEFKSKIQLLEGQLDSPSLSQAKRYALKKSLAMERSKVIREERRLGLRK